VKKTHHFLRNCQKIFPAAKLSDEGARRIAEKGLTKTRGVDKIMGGNVGKFEVQRRTLMKPSQRSATWVQRKRLEEDQGGR